MSSEKVINGLIAGYVLTLLSLSFSRGKTDFGFKDGVEVLVSLLDLWDVLYHDRSLPKIPSSQPWEARARLALSLGILLDLSDVMNCSRSVRKISCFQLLLEQDRGRV